ETEALEVLERSFSSKLAFMLQLQTVDIAASTALIDFGLDSLIAVEIRSWLTKELGVDVPVFKLLGGATLSEISREAFDQFLPSRDRDDAVVDRFLALSSYVAVDAAGEAGWDRLKQ
ncbi:MAG: hypothetical protein M1823_008993, partial [Watsoniomyces obsoletus]